MTGATRWAEMPDLPTAKRYLGSPGHGFRGASQRNPKLTRRQGAVLAVTTPFVAETRRSAAREPIRLCRDEMRIVGVNQSDLGVFTGRTRCGIV